MFNNVVTGLLHFLTAWFDASRFSLLPPAPRIINPKDEWFYRREWQRAEREAQDDLRAGRYEDFITVDEVIAVLKQNDPAATAQLEQVDRVAHALRRFQRRRK